MSSEVDVSDVNELLGLDGDAEDVHMHSDSEELQPDDEKAHFSNRGHDWIAERYFNLLEEGGRAPTPSDIATDTDDSDDDAHAAADVDAIRLHIIFRVLRVVVCTNSVPSDWYDSRKPHSEWVCPLLECTYTVDPLGLDPQARRAVVSLFGEGGIETERWTGRSVLARDAEYELDTDHCRLSMSASEVLYRRVGMDWIGWKHFEAEHIGKYGVEVRDAGEADGVGHRGVAFCSSATNRMIAVYVGGAAPQHTEEMHQRALTDIRAAEVQRLVYEAHRVRVDLTRWHRRQERFLDRAVAFCHKISTNEAYHAKAGRVVMAGLERIRDTYDIERAHARLKDLEASIVAWQAWDLISFPIPDVLQ
ncbi:unnamed protein product [Peniophora sp. CBMAI 1063]|nr:unnamed protein product [Peniophora sp. CBMAI 1063]